jgi:hypothetical protein
MATSYDGIEPIADGLSHSRRNSVTDGQAAGVRTRSAD